MAEADAGTSHDGSANAGEPPSTPAEPADWQGKKVELDEHGLPKPLRWRPVFLWRALVFGFLFDLAAEVLLQQLGKQILTVYSLFHAAIVGTILGIVAPSLGGLIGVLWANKHIRAARQQEGRAA